MDASRTSMYLTNFLLHGAIALEEVITRKDHPHWAQHSEMHDKCLTNAACFPETLHEDSMRIWW